MLIMTEARTLAEDVFLAITSPYSLLHDSQNNFPPSQMGERDDGLASTR